MLVSYDQFQVTTVDCAFYSSQACGRDIVKATIEKRAFTLILFSGLIFWSNQPLFRNQLYLAQITWVNELAHLDKPISKLNFSFIF